MRRFGTALAGLAVYLQLVFASGGMLLLSMAGNPAVPFESHALCLAGSGDDARTPPADTTPAAPAHDHFALCCLWHSLPGVTPQASLAPVPVTYATVAQDAGGTIVFDTGPIRGPAEARAPPTV